MSFLELFRFVLLPFGLTGSTRAYRYSLKPSPPGMLARADPKTDVAPPALFLGDFVSFGFFFLC